MSTDTKEHDRAGRSADFEDELGAYVEQSKQDDPAFRVAYEDAERLHEIIDKLVKLRKALRLNQTEVARRMGVRQPTVSGFETEGSDPRLSTLQRYARAVEAALRVDLELPADCDWASTSTAAYRGQAVMDPSAPVNHSARPTTWATAQHEGPTRTWAKARHVREKGVPVA